VTIVWVRVHVGDGRDADVRRLDDIDGVYWPDGRGPAPVETNTKESV
jgi:hypothetical protein